MNSKTTHLKIITTDKIVYDDDVEVINLKTAIGYIGILPNHAPFVSNIDIGKLTINYENSEKYRISTISDGMVYVEPHNITILTDDIIFAEDINIERAELDKKLAMKNLEIYKHTHEALQYEIKLKKALNRIDVYNSFKK